LKRVRADCVGPIEGEGDLLSGTLLQEQLVLRIKEKDAECSVKEALFDELVEVALGEN